MLEIELNPTPEPIPCSSQNLQDPNYKGQKSTPQHSSAQLPGQTTQPDPIELQRQQEIKRKALARKRAREHLRLRSPEPVEGRKHVDVQTELYLEELADRIIEVDMECQTDAFLDRPPTPLFIPAKTGRDVATQILEGELFNFDIEVKPMLEVLVGKTIEQALLEVLEEEELAELRMHQQRFEELRNLELAEVQRLEEQERRHQKEKERRRQQQLAVLHKQNETSQKIAARAYAKIYLADLLPSVFGNLRDNGYFYDPIERDIEIGFLPWLMHEVDKTMEYQTVGRVVLDMMIRDVVENRLKMFEQLGVKESKSIPDENDKERKESLGTGAEQVIEDVNQQDSQQTNGSLEKKPSAEGKLSMERKPSAERKQSTEKDSLEKSASLEKKKSVEKVPSEEIEP
ncbi:radial spoke head protein 3 homolog isoform X2 [Vombatus ursinus]|uniref:radial spoke head protein 3 homolog isoform X2 n=1 Tax=Vombatus ursinus TaxID=29139 RepID=UPI000FFD77F5|nr:radial spoke head protein 3 homolog isoform X2 [Vombatus ursinus]XP_027702391.1 radial spoke head protein 3 homolog isoform X2 [Vombatus ursinus]